MSQIEVSYVLLHRTSKGWRTTVAEFPTALACGALEETPADAPFELAAAEFEKYVRRHWRVTQKLVWVERDADWWSADVRGSAADAI